MSNKTNQYTINHPLMYIKQPNLKPTKIKMQTHYVSKSKLNKHRKLKDRKLNVNRNKREQIKNNEISNSSNVIEKEKKSFRELNIEERIDYLLNMSKKQMPIIICEVKTDRGSFRGIVKSKEDHMLILKPLASMKMIPIAVDEITSIRMISF